MKNVRLFYTKRDKMRFVSHLDMTRFITRLIRRAHLPVWYTEGFNPHIYLLFALPLSLGMDSDYEICDIRLLQDDFPLETLCERLNAVCGEYVHFFKAESPILNPGDVAFADFYIRFDDGAALSEPLCNFFKRENITVQKRTKKGELKLLEVADKIKRFEICDKKGFTELSITLPAGSQENINPELILTAFFEQENTAFYCYNITRKSILDSQLNLFK